MIWTRTAPASTPLYKTVWRLSNGQTPLTTADHAYRKYKSHMSSIISRKVGRPKTDTDLFSMQCKVFFWCSICIHNIKINILYYCIFKNPHHWYFNNFVTICRGYSPTRWGWGMAVAKNSQNKVESCSFWQRNCINCESFIKLLNFGTLDWIQRYNMKKFPYVRSIV